MYLIILPIRQLGYLVSGMDLKHGIDGVYYHQICMVALGGISNVQRHNKTTRANYTNILLAPPQDGA